MTIAECNLQAMREVGVSEARINTIAQWARADVSLPSDIHRRELTQEQAREHIEWLKGVMRHAATSPAASEAVRIAFEQAYAERRAAN